MNAHVPMNPRDLATDPRFADGSRDGNSALFDLLVQQLGGDEVARHEATRLWADAVLIAQAVPTVTWVVR